MSSTSARRLAGDGRLATRARMRGVGGIVRRPDGTLVFVDAMTERRGARRAFDVKLT